MDGSTIELQLEYGVGVLTVTAVDKIGEHVRSQVQANYSVYDGYLVLEDYDGKNASATDTIIFTEEAVIALAMQDMIPGEDFAVLVRISMHDHIIETEMGFSFEELEAGVFEG